MTARTTDLSNDATADVDWHLLDDRFVPIRACDLIAALADDAKYFDFDRDAFCSVAGALHDVIAQESETFRRELADKYAAFNPDRDTRQLDTNTPPPSQAELARDLAYLLEKANFQRLSEVQIDAAIKIANTHGLRVKLDPERIDHLEIWVRGRGSVDHDCRTWRHPVKGQHSMLDIYRRIVVIARLRDDPHVQIKIFKDIPIGDLEALLPHAEVEMTWLDRVLMLGGGAGTVGTTAMKISKIALSFAMLSRLLWIVLFGAAILTYRTFMGYRRRRSDRDSQRTRHLYYQNLSNNGAALHTLVSMIEQEELKEAVLAYAFCHRLAAQSWTPDSLGEQVGEYLGEKFNLRTDFDAPDAIETLTRH